MRVGRVESVVMVRWGQALTDWRKRWLFSKLPSMSHLYKRVALKL